MYKKIISTSIVVSIAIVLGVAVSSQDNQVVKADTPKSSIKPLVIETAGYVSEQINTEQEVTDYSQEEIVTETADEPYITIYYTEQDIIDIAKVLYNECRGVNSKTEQACPAVPQMEEN